MKSGQLLPVRSCDTITADAALAIVRAAIEHGRQRGVRVVVAVTGPEGDLIALWADDGAFSPSRGIAADKAYTAAVFRTSTDDLAASLADDPLLIQGIAARPRVVLFGGGMPIASDNTIIGAIGVSGGSQDDDRACAVAGIAALALPQREMKQ